MSNPAAVAPLPATSSAPRFGLSVLQGRIVGARRLSTQNGTLWLTLLKLPAPDEYTAPATVEVRSGSKLGELRTDWQGRVRIGGYGRSFEQKDRETGEVSTVQTAEVRLTVIED